MGQVMQGLFQTCNKVMAEGYWYTKVSIQYIFGSGVAFSAFHGAYNPLGLLSLRPYLDNTPWAWMASLISCTMCSFPLNIQASMAKHRFIRHVHITKKRNPERTTSHRKFVLIRARLIEIMAAFVLVLHVTTTFDFLKTKKAPRHYRWRRLLLLFWPILYSISLFSCAHVSYPMVL